MVNFDMRLNGAMIGMVVLILLTICIMYRCCQSNVTNDILKERKGETLTQPNRKKSKGDIMLINTGKKKSNRQKKRKIKRKGNGKLSQTVQKETKRWTFNFFGKSPPKTSILEADEEQEKQEKNHYKRNKGKGTFDGRHHRINYALVSLPTSNHEMMSNFSSPSSMSYSGSSYVSHGEEETKGDRKRSPSFQDKIKLVNNHLEIQRSHEDSESCSQIVNEYQLNQSTNHTGMTLPTQDASYYRNKYIDENEIYSQYDDKKDMSKQISRSPLETMGKPSTLQKVEKESLWTSIPDQITQVGSSFLESLSYTFQYSNQGYQEKRDEASEEEDEEEDDDEDDDDYDITDEEEEEMGSKEGDDVTIDIINQQDVRINME